MAFLKIIVLILVMNWTWNVVHHDNTVAEDTHISIQQDLKKIITDLIEQKVPSASNIVFHKFWTESLSQNQVKAYFNYSFIDADMAKVILDGFAIVNKDSESDNETEVWNFEEFYVLNNKVEYSEPLHISPDQNETQSQ